MKDIDKLNIWLDFLVDKGREIEEVQGFIESSSSIKNTRLFSEMLNDYEQMVVKAKKNIFDIIEEMINKHS
jgi:AAA+ ATPase superfamily predicted ATPase